MANTLSSIRTRVRRYLKESDATTSFWTADFLDQLFNAQYRRRCAQLIMAYEGWFTNVATRDLEANKDRYAFPQNFQRLRKLELVRSDGRTVPLERFERHVTINPGPNDAATDDQYTPTFRPISNGFVLEPQPATTVTDGLRLEYEGLPVELSAPGDTIHPSFPDIFDELLILDTTVAAFDAEGMQESGLSRSLLRLREEWTWDWERFIDARIVTRQAVEPFVTHYSDS
jgi:hypothetical protein